MTCLQTIGRWALSPLAMAACLTLASCEANFDAEDRAFGRATQQRLSGDFQKQIAALSAAEKSLPATGTAVKVPAGFAPWWDKQVAAKLFADSQPVAQGLDDLLARALKHSTQIKVFSDIPLIRETGIQEARGRFDHHMFVETTYEHVNEPVGSTLKLSPTAGIEDRFKEWDRNLEVGVKRKLITGADVKLSQQVRRTSNNSMYFVPDHQAAAKLGLTVIQPLLKGGGIKYNRSFIRIAKLDSEIGRNEFIRQAESHLLQLARAYWNLYLSRALCAQKSKLVTDTADLVGKLEKRTDIDAMQGELMQAKAALAKRRADLVRAEMAIKNGEDRIKALVNDPALLPGPAVELLPAGAPSINELNVDMKQAAADALENRPEIAQAFLQLKTAAIRKDMAKNEILPQLDLILETSIAGLDQAGRLCDGWDDQWKHSHPGFLVGLRFDLPVENNIGEARLTRRRIEVRQQIAQVQTTIDTVLLEVKISAREVATSYREMNSRYESMLAAQEDLRVLQKRWESHAGAANKPAIGYLQLLLDAQDRLAQAEEDFARASAIYNVAIINLQRSQGTLLKYEELEINTTEDEAGLPVMGVGKKGAAPMPKPMPKTKPAPAPKAKPAAAPKATSSVEPKPVPAPKAKVATAAMTVTAADELKPVPAPEAKPAK